MASFPRYVAFLKSVLADAMLEIMQEEQKL